MLYILNVLAPVFLLIALGAVLRGARFLPRRFFRELNRLVYWVALPAFLFLKIATAGFRGSEAMEVSLALALVMGMTIGVALVTGLLLGMSGPSVGALTQAAYRANLVYVGWPVIAYAAASRMPEAAGSISGFAVLVVVPIVPLYNVAAVLILALSAGGKDGVRTALGPTVRTILTNPLILACLAALPVFLLGVKLPLAVERTCEGVGRVALPLALISIGASLSPVHLRGHLLRAILAGILRTGLGPVLAWMVGGWLGLDDRGMLVVLLYMACPTAVVSYVFAEQLGGDSELAGSAVMSSTLMSLVSLAVVLYLTAL